jgi:hypothetical protein
MGKTDPVEECNAYAFIVNNDYDKDSRKRKNPLIPGMIDET